MEEVKERRSIEETLEIWRKYCSYFREYPDRFIDFITHKDSTFRLFAFQRMFLRIFFRYKTSYMVFTRGTSKSFLQVLALFLKCIMYPGIKLFICSPGREQAVGIAEEKLREILSIWPILNNEIAKENIQNDILRIYFKNGSVLDVIPISSTTRGRRRHGGAIEEICEMDGKKDILNSVVLPTMQIDRRAANGKVDPNEIKKFTLYLTTAGTRQSFAFEKAQAVINEMKQGKKSIYIGAGYELGVMFGLFDEEHIAEKQADPTMSPISFEREYGSVWTGSSDRSFVKQKDLEACRSLKAPEFRADKRKHPDAEYVISFDVARAEGAQNDQSAISVIKIIPRGDGTYRKQLVYIHSFEGRHFEQQARFIKEKVNEYEARIVCIDANAIGYGLVDYLVTELGDGNPPYSVVNDDRFDHLKKPNSIPMLYLVKGQSRDTRNADIFNAFANCIAKRDIQLLEPSLQARANLEKDKKLKSMDGEKKAEYLTPFILTDHLIEEILNHEYRMSGNTINVQRIKKSVPRDKFMSLAYGLHYIYLLEQENQNRRREQFDPSGYIFISKAKFKRKGGIF